jgi:IS5 family transposase
VRRSTPPSAVLPEGDGGAIKLHADKAYDSRRCRRALRRRGITPRIARRGIESSTRLGRHRWVVERTLAWFARFRRLVVRYERRSDIFAAFHHLAAALITFRFIERWLNGTAAP